MRILMFTDSLRAGGKERQLVELIKVLLKKGIKIELVSMNKNIFYKEILNLDIKIHFLIRKFKKDPSIMIRLGKICKSFQPDIIHTWDTMTSIYAVPVAKLLRIKLLNGLIRDSPNKIKIFSKKWVAKTLSFPFSDVILANSRAGLKAYKIKKKGKVIHNGFDFNRIDNLKNKDEIRKEFKITTEKVVGMVAAFSKYKNYLAYLTAARNILKNRSDITFLAIGEGSNLDKFKHIFNNDKIIFIKNQSNIMSLINVFNIGVLTSFGEGIPNCVMEYMALKKPVIATNLGGTNELIEDEKTGFLLNKNNDQLVNKLNLLLDNKELALKMGQEGGKKLLEFSPEKMCGAFINLYSSLLKK